jgi:hypothetical protein
MKKIIMVAVIAMTVVGFASAKGFYGSFGLGVGATYDTEGRGNQGWLMTDSANVTLGYDFGGPGVQFTAGGFVDGDFCFGGGFILAGASWTFDSVRVWLAPGFVGNGGGVGFALDAGILFPVNKSFGINLDALLTVQENARVRITPQLSFEYMF